MRGIDLVVAKVLGHDDKQQRAANVTGYCRARPRTRRLSLYSVRSEGGLFYGPASIVLEYPFVPATVAVTTQYDCIRTACPTQPSLDPCPRATVECDERQGARTGAGVIP